MPANIVRQNDVAVKYTSWSLAFILPDTTLVGAQNLADKLPARGVGRAAAVGLDADHAERRNRGSGGETGLQSEDIVTDLINRAEFSAEEARKSGGDTIVVSESPKI